MRIITFTLLLIFYSFSGFSQITLTSGTHGPVNGDLTWFLLSDTTEFDPGAAGVAQTWDFVLNTNLNSGFHGKYQSPGSTPYGGFFPGSTTAVFDSAQFSYVYYKLNNNLLSLQGFADSFFQMVYSNDEILMRYPFTYNSVSNDSFRAVYTDTTFSQRTTRIGSVSVTGDAYGALKFFGKTFNNTLRVKTTEIYDDYIVDTEFGDTFEVQHYRNTTYQWFITSAKFPVFEYSFRTSSSSLDSGFIDSLRMIRVNEMFLTGVETKERSLNVNIYPDPAADNLTVAFDHPAEGKVGIVLYDMTGKELKSVEYGSHAASFQAGLDVSGLPRGIYLLKISNEGTEAIRKIILK